MAAKRKSFPQDVLEHQFKSVLITIGNAAKSLAALAIATPINFSCLVPAEGRTISSDENQSTKRRTGPSIVKAVRPCKVKPVASVRPLLSRQSEKAEVVIIELISNRKEFLLCKHSVYTHTKHMN
ncbi:hypothetical protein NECAME_16477 [Necator americanus]|uniref:Uncharacterized protein n=1 Tax=Necator americanus TaxID=51031 RepID=W2TVK0_NECAM|nr:hypothetical protein NECAME_16477 [Necator americanus]ETN86125.1 hypothetical protein NECAME_16477 [Necator americanus]